MHDWTGHRAVVVGGSIGGLTTALLLRRLGFDVSVFERTPEGLDGRGGGIALHPETVRWFAECSSQRPERVSTSARCVQYLGEGDAVVHTEPLAWTFTSWGTFHHALLADFGDGDYHLGEYAAGFDQDADGVEVRFASGRRERADLVVFADGVTSAARRRISPATELTYAGYVGWRGTVPEKRLSPDTFARLHDAITYSFAPHTHLVAYPIPAPGGGLEIGDRLMNYVWYRNVADGYQLDELMTDRRGVPAKVSLHPGAVQDRYVDEMRSAAVQLLAPAVAELVARTEFPFVQAVFDVAADRMVLGRAVLLGDAACAVRPHPAAATAKAAADAWALHDALAETTDIGTALGRWEPAQLALARQLFTRAREMAARSQVSCSWDPADPANRFGLHGPAW
ncbi:FAD-dependent monooxygenase [Mycolicibacterium sp. F2034L]|uniref:FAD binding domain-containing protein n=1 Tax=Mycolicibacterium sp. F2034L TaxID=2926422 RepID=UPI001FF613EF|nr:FAD-dependent monooxygenase [Mycolicibacterium sp. F2034L]MCK0173159.1 FAD-dependent monooxygenase [Mycolicibacterium sp. F2034L]